MELCNGGRLLDEMARYVTFSELHATFVIKDLTSVVKYCHEMGVIHRDNKPEYILLTGNREDETSRFWIGSMSH